MKNYYLFAILFVYLISRLFLISTNPPALYWDEASIAYNAYSILTTGKDEWGAVYPAEFRAFGEFKLPLYIYLTAVFQFVFGLNEWTVRLPSVLAGLGCVILVYLLAFKLTKSRDIALLSAFHITLVPALFIFTRAGYEATLGLLFYLLGVISFLNASKNSWMLVISTISFVLSLFCYNAFRMVTPLTILTLIFLVFLNNKINLRKMIIPAALSLGMLFVALFSIYQSFRSGSGSTRLDEVGILNSFAKKQPLIHQVGLNYLSHFNPNYLFVQGDLNQRSQQGDFGQFYFLDLLLIIVGVYAALKTRKKILLVPIALLLIGPLPASIARESPHGLRSIALVPFWSVLAGIGAWKILDMTHSIIQKKIYIILYITMFSIYLLRFFIVYPIESYEDWQGSYKTLFTTYDDLLKSYDRVTISDSYNQPYIFALTYLKYPANKFRDERELNTTIRKETSVVKSMDNLIFTNVDFYNLPQGKSLVVSHPNDKMDEIYPKEIIKFPSGKSMFYLYEYQK